MRSGDRVGGAAGCVRVWGVNRQLSDKRSNAAPGRVTLPQAKVVTRACACRRSKEKRGGVPEADAARGRIYSECGRLGRPGRWAVAERPVRPDPARPGVAGV